MSRSYKKAYTKSKRFDKSCRCNGGCPYCYNNRMYQHDKVPTLKEEIEFMEKNENNQEYYNSIMNLELAKHIVKLRDSNISWKDVAKSINEKYGPEFALEVDTITGMYLEYSARDYMEDINKDESEEDNS